MDKKTEKQEGNQYDKIVKENIEIGTPKRHHSSLDE